MEKIRAYATYDTVEKELNPFLYETKREADESTLIDNCIYHEQYDRFVTVYVTIEEA